MLRYHSDPGNTALIAQMQSAVENDRLVLHWLQAERILMNFQHPGFNAMKWGNYIPTFVNAV